MDKYTKEELHDFLVRRAGAIEDINRVNEDTNNELFVDGVDCLHRIFIQEKAFFDVCEVLGLEFKVYESESDSWKYYAETKTELFAKEYILFCYFNEEEEGAKTE